MRRILLLSVLGLALLAGCGSSTSAPRAGDTITPVLGTASRWKVGSSPEISARLQARGKDGKTRQLDFDGIATNPVVRVVFFADATELGASQVTLSHRC